MATSKEYYIPAIDGDYQEGCIMGFHGNHQIAVSGVDGDFGGTLTITARAPGGKLFEPVADGVIDLAAIKTILFIFSVAEYKFTLSGVTGSVAGSQILITDIPLEI